MVSCSAGCFLKFFVSFTFKFHFRTACMEHPPNLTVTEIEIEKGAKGSISDELAVRIQFVFDRDVVDAWWTMKILVDCCDQRIIKVLQKTEPRNYRGGEEDEQVFDVESIDLRGIPQSTLNNAGLILMSLCVDGEEIASVNLVVNVLLKNGQLNREILNPME